MRNSQSALHMRILFHSIILLTACQLHSIYMHTFKQPNVLACGICGDAHVTLSTSTFKEAPSPGTSSYLPAPPPATFSHCIFAVAVGIESDRNNTRLELLFFYVGHFFPVFPVSLESPAFTGMIEIPYFSFRYL